MGLMAQIAKVFANSQEKLNGAIGKTVVTSANGLGGQGIKAESYSPAGLVSRPPIESRGIFIPIAGRRYGVFIGFMNYNLPDVVLKDGETLLYSTTQGGSAFKSKVYLDDQGRINLNGDTKYFVTHAELDTALQAFKNALNTHTHPTAATGPPSPPTVPLTLDISAAKTTTIRTGG